MTLPSLYIFDIFRYINTSSNIFNIDKFTHQYVTRNKENKLMVPIHKLKLYEKSPKFMAIKVLNKIVKCKYLYRENLLMKWKLILTQKAYYKIT